MSCYGTGRGATSFVLNHLKTRKEDEVRTFVIALSIVDTLWMQGGFFKLFSQSVYNKTTHKGYNGLLGLTPSAPLISVNNMLGL